MKKNHKAIPDRVIRKLVSIRKALLFGDVGLWDGSDGIGEAGLRVVFGHGCGEYGCHKSGV